MYIFKTYLILEIAVIVFGVIVFIQHIKTEKRDRELYEEFFGKPPNSDGVIGKTTEESLRNFQQFDWDRMNGRPLSIDYEIENGSEVYFEFEPTERTDKDRIEEVNVITQNGKNTFVQNKYLTIKKKIFVPKGKTLSEAIEELNEENSDNEIPMRTLDDNYISFSSPCGDIIGYDGWNCVGWSANVRNKYWLRQPSRSDVMKTFEVFANERDRGGLYV